MTENAQAKVSLIDEFKSLNIKQVIAIVGAMIIAVILQTYGFAEQCMGFLIIAAVLYMVPHLLKVTSVKIKAVIGTVFVVIALLTTTLISGPAIVENAENQIDRDSNDLGNIDYVLDGMDATITVDVYTDKMEKIELHYGEVGSLTYRSFGFKDHTSVPMTVTPVEGDDKVLYKATATVPAKDATLNGYQILMFKKVLDDNGEIVTDGDGNAKLEKTGLAFFYNTGASQADIYKVGLSGLWVYVAFTAAMFFMILIFSALMRRSAEKTRQKMEADGRLYPKGYGRCKECGGMVLPGEVNCRKCGAYIDVPEELRAQKKDYFVCEKCGAEVPNDAEICPKCGAKFDSTETEIVHADGSVDVSEETFECSECGATVPANATRCPNCGATFDEDEDAPKKE